jgi:hypothetical protein
LPPHLQHLCTDHPTLSTTYPISSITCFVSAPLVLWANLPNTMVCTFRLHMIWFCLMQFSVSGNGPYYLALSGHTYHRVFPMLHPNHPVHWFLYDAQAALDHAASTEVPLAIMNGI